MLWVNSLYHPLTQRNIPKHPKAMTSHRSQAMATQRRTWCPVPAPSAERRQRTSRPASLRCDFDDNGTASELGTWRTQRDDHGLKDCPWTLLVSAVSICFCFLLCPLEVARPLIEWCAGVTPKQAFGPDEEPWTWTKLWTVFYCFFQLSMSTFLLRTTRFQANSTQELWAIMQMSWTPQCTE